MEAATAPGRNLAMGIAAMGQGLGKAIEQYRTKKAETEAADQSRETLVGLYQQQLASDPKYIAIQQYAETGQLPEGVTEQDIPRYTQKVQIAHQKSPL
jgi:ABC-type ATPase with predicted acetyltransferase domain